MGKKYYSEEERNAARLRRHHERMADPEYKEEYRTRQRSRRLAKRYRITLKEYEAMLTKQGGVCAICGRPPSKHPRWSTSSQLGVDHDHRTGRVRGLLCGKCNLRLEWFEEFGLEIQRYLDEA